MPKARTRKPFTVVPPDKPENYVEVDPALKESNNPLPALLKPHLMPGEMLLWAGKTRISDQDNFFSPRTCALTNLRALVVSPENRLEMARWEEVVRVNMTRRLNGTGRLELIIKPGSQGVNTRINLKNCPDFSKVQRLVERIFFKADSDPASPVETEEEVTEPSRNNSEGGLPLRWRYRLEAELLPGEQLRWVGRANPQGVKKMLQGCLIWSVIPVVALLILNWWILAIPVLALLVITLAFVYLVLLDTAYAVTQYRVLQVSGMRRGSLRRTIEFYPRLDFKQVRPADPKTDLSRSMGGKFADLILAEEIYYGARVSERRSHPIYFYGIYRQDLEWVTELIGEVCRRGPAYRNHFKQ